VVVVLVFALPSILVFFWWVEWEKEKKEEFSIEIYLSFRGKENKNLPKQDEILIYFFPLFRSTLHLFVRVVSAGSHMIVHSSFIFPIDLISRCDGEREGEIKSREREKELPDVSLSI